MKRGFASSSAKSGSRGTRADRGVCPGVCPTRRSEGVADGEEGSELLEDSACRIVRSRNDLLPGEGGEVVPEFRPQEHVRDRAELRAAAHAEDDFPYIIGSRSEERRVGKERRSR